MVSPHPTPHEQGAPTASMSRRPTHADPATEEASSRDCGTSQSTRAKNSIPRTNEKLGHHTTQHDSPRTEGAPEREGAAPSSQPFLHSNHSALAERPRDRSHVAKRYTTEITPKSKSRHTPAPTDPHAPHPIMTASLLRHGGDASSATPTQRQAPQHAKRPPLPPATHRDPRNP